MRLACSGPQPYLGLGSPVGIYPFLGLVRGQAAALLPRPPPSRAYVRNAQGKSRAHLGAAGDGPRVQCGYTPLLSVVARPHSPLIRSPWLSCRSYLVLVDAKLVPIFHRCRLCTANFRRCMAGHKEQQPCPGLRHQRQVQGNDMGQSIPASAALVTMAVMRLFHSQRQRAHGKG